jgi:hypothetical protein
MGDVYTDNYAAAFNQSPGKLIPASREKRVILEIYEAVTLASGSVIYVCRPPKGYRLVGGSVWSDNLGNAATLAVGTGITGAAVAADPTKFMAATTHGSAVTKTELLVAALIDSVDYEFDGSTDLIITTGTGTAGGTIRIKAEFSCPH